MKHYKAETSLRAPVQVSEAHARERGAQPCCRLLPQLVHAGPLLPAAAARRRNPSLRIFIGSPEGRLWLFPLGTAAGPYREVSRHLSATPQGKVFHCVSTWCFTVLGVCL
eukprot:SM004463S16475  [mRNA]  locus=s4463:109:442:+ [translate_table: standard]